MFTMRILFLETRFLYDYGLLSVRPKVKTENRVCKIHNKGSKTGQKHKSEKSLLACLLPTTLLPVLKIPRKRPKNGICLLPLLPYYYTK